jgi:hypothetical protein
MRNPPCTATNPRESSDAWLVGGISTAYPASHPEQGLITTLRLGSSGVPSGIVKFAPGAQEGISGGHFPARVAVRFGLQADAISGDNGQRGTLGTLNASFPRGAYFGPKFALIGPANLLSLQPQFVFHPLRNVTGTFE